jgi:FMN phosphatase YigB (HAD superfamily)
MTFLQTLPVDRVATSAGWGVAKPDPAFFARVAAGVGAAPERIAYVGDRVDNEVLPASRAGMLAGGSRASTRSAALKAGP